MQQRACLLLISLGLLAPAGCRGSDSSELEELTPERELPTLEAAPPLPELSPREHDSRGDEHLKAGRFEEAITDFDRFLAAEPEADPHHWRRGIAYYYAGQYAEGAAQFERHRGVNPADVENAAWHFLCKARQVGVTAARAALLPVAPDGRPPMMTIYELFAGRATPQDVLDVAARATPSQAESALFYGHLYVGLYYEATGAAEKARLHIELAAMTHTSANYMGDIARMHAELLAR